MTFGDGNVRFGVDFVEEASAVFFGKYASKAPGLLLEGLDVLDVDDQYVARFSGFDLEGSGEVVNACQVNVSDIVCGIVVANLAASPVDAFNLDYLIVLDSAAERNWMSSVWCWGSELG